MNLRELFEACLAENNNNTVRAAQQFIVKAKKENPDVKMNDCMITAGFNEKTKQNFRNNVVIPVRNRIAKIKFNLSEDTIQRLFGRSQEDLTDEEKNTKKNIQELLPGRTRTTASKNMDHIDSLLAVEENAE